MVGRIEGMAEDTHAGSFFLVMHDMFLLFRLFWYE